MLLVGSEELGRTRSWKKNLVVKKFYDIINKKIGLVVQLVEHLIRIEEVSGSSPLEST